MEGVRGVVERRGLAAQSVKLAFLCQLMGAPRAEDCYTPLGYAVGGVLEHCRAVAASSATVWQRHYGFLATRIGQEWVEREPALQAVDRLCPIAQMGILQMPDHSVYQWHRDQHRQACINMLLSEEHSSHTLFVSEVGTQSMQCIELCYEPGRFYLFNNQMPHSVVNLSGNRYLLSLEFEKPFTYGELRKQAFAAGLVAPVADHTGHDEGIGK